MYIFHKLCANLVCPDDDDDDAVCLVCLACRDGDDDDAVYRPEHVDGRKWPDSMTPMSMIRAVDLVCRVLPVCRVCRVSMVCRVFRVRRVFPDDRVLPVCPDDDDDDAVCADDVACPDG